MIFFRKALELFARNAYNNASICPVDGYEDVGIGRFVVCILEYHKCIVKLLNLFSDHASHLFIEIVGVCQIHLIHRIFRCFANLGIYPHSTVNDHGKMKHLKNIYLVMWIVSCFW